MHSAWKIGTSVSSYIKRWDEWVKRDFSAITIEKIDNTRSKAVFNSSSLSEEFKDSTLSQIIRVLLSLGMLTAVGQKDFKNNGDILIPGTKFKIITPERNRSDFILENLIELEKRVYDSEMAIYENESNFAFSVFSSLLKMEDGKNTKFIIEVLDPSISIDSYFSYYKKLYDEVKDASKYNQFITTLEDKLIGFAADTKKIMEHESDVSEVPTINSYNKQYEDWKFVEPRFQTWGGFLKRYFTEDKVIKIPIFQRKYVWGERELRVLLNDIRETTESNDGKKPDHPHYIGNIIVSSVTPSGMDATTISILDGQQRLTTLVIVARALLDFLSYKGFKVDKMLKNKFDVNYENNILTNFIRIEGNEDFKAFETIVKGLAYKDDNSYSKTKLLINYRKAISWMAVNLSSEKESMSFMNKFLNSTIFTTIEMKGLKEFELFEKLNTGGIKLNTLELFKNYIIDKFEKEVENDERMAQENFENKIAKYFTGTSGNANMEKFIKAIIRLENSKINDKSTLFEEYKELINQNLQNNVYSNFVELLDSIEEQIQMFMEVSQYDRYKESSSPLAFIADFLFMFSDRENYYPLIIKTLKNHNFEFGKDMSYTEINSIRKYLRIVEIFEVRLQVATYRGQSLGKKIESILMKYNEETTLQEFWSMFNNSDSNSTGMPTVDEFKLALETRKIENKPAKLIMTRFINYFSMKNNWDYFEDTRIKGLFKKVSNREHLLPKKWKKHWAKDLHSWTIIDGVQMDKTLIEANVEKYVDFIGNALPIPWWSNNDMSNDNLTKKNDEIINATYYDDIKILIEGYKGDEGTLSPIGNSFTHDNIIKRSEQIASIAAKIWGDPKF